MRISKLYNREDFLADLEYYSKNYNINLPKPEINHLIDQYWN